MSSFNRIRLKDKEFCIEIFLVLIIFLTILFQSNIIYRCNNNKRLLKSPELAASVSTLWSFNTRRYMRSSPALGDVNSDGILEVIIGSGDHKVYALNGKDGSEVWSFTTGDNVWSSPALGDVDGDGTLEVVIGSTDFKVYALNGEEGSEFWNFTTGGDVDSSPALGDVDGDGMLEVVVGSNDNKTYALNGEDGSELWNFSTGSGNGGVMNHPMFSSPALGDVDSDDMLEVIIGSNDGNVYALNGEDGSKLWNFTTGDVVDSSPALGDVDGDGTLEVVIGSWDNKTYALNGEDGSELWNFTTGGLVGNSPALGDVDSDGKLEVVIGSWDNKIYTLNGEDGSELWNFRADSFVFSSPALGDVDGDGTLEIVIGGIDESVYALNGEDGSQLWRFRTVSNVFSSPALGDVDGDGTLEIVIADDNGKVYALNPEPSGKRVYWNGLSGDTTFTRCKNQQYHDSDFDMLSNYSEVIYNTDPLDPDPDNDFLLDGNEISFHTNATNPDTDGDSLLDGVEIYNYSTNPNDADTDNDGFNDSYEIRHNFDPNNPLSNPRTNIILIFTIPTIMIIAGLLVYFKIRKNKKKKKEYFEDLNNYIKDILQYELEKKKEITIHELVENFNLNFDIAYKYHKLLNSSIKYSKEETFNIKEKAKEVIQKLEKPTLYSIINNLEYDFKTAKKVSKFLVDKNILEKEVRIPEVGIDLIHKKERVKSDLQHNTIFLSYSTLDSGYFQIPEIAKELENYSEIDKILFWEADSGENIVEYMEKTLKECNVFVLFCSENSLNSRAVTDEWQAAFQLRKKDLLKIIPVYEDEKFIPALLTPLLNVKFEKKNLEKFIENLYNEILRR